MNVLSYMDVNQIVVNDYPTESDNLRHIGILRETWQLNNSSLPVLTIHCFVYHLGQQVGRGKVVNALQVQRSYGVASIHRLEIFVKYISRRNPA